MALDIPMPDSPGNSFVKGVNTGSDLIHKMMLNKYYGQLHPSGDVANAMYVEQLRQQYGDNDPRYIQAKHAHELALQGRESLIGYRDILNQTAGVRGSSALGKEILEGKGQGAQDILNKLRANQGTGTPGKGDSYGYSYDADGNNIVASPEEIDAAGRGNGTIGDNNPRTAGERSAYERAINKKTSDAQARNILLRAENLDKTRNSIDPEDLTRYSGLKGTGNWLRDSAQAALGHPSAQYLAHQQAINSATLMVDQMRQFYGDSIQPAAMARLTHLANPSTFLKDPKVAKAQFAQLNKILDTETETYRNHASSPITLNKIDFKDGQFKAVKNPRTTSSANSNEGGTFDMEKVVPQLLKIDPRYTEKNIRSTAKETGKSIDQVINELFQRSVKKGQ